MRKNNDIKVLGLAIGFLIWLGFTCLIAYSFSCLDNKFGCDVGDLINMAFVSIAFLGPAFIAFKIFSN